MLITAGLNYYQHKKGPLDEPEKAASSPENPFILDAVWVFLSVLLECTAECAAAGWGGGQHTHTCLCPPARGLCCVYAAKFSVSGAIANSSEPLRFSFVLVLDSAG